MYKLHTMHYTHSLIHLGQNFEVYVVGFVAEC